MPEGPACSCAEIEGLDWPQPRRRAFASLALLVEEELDDLCSIWIWVCPDCVSLWREVDDDYGPALGFSWDPFPLRELARIYGEIADFPADPEGLASWLAGPRPHLSRSQWGDSWQRPSVS